MARAITDISPLPIDHVRHVASLAQAALLKKFGKSDVCDFFAEIDFRHGSRFRRQSPNCWYGVGTTVGTIEGVPHATGSRLNDARETT